MMAPFVLAPVAPGRWRSATDPCYWNQIGPFGGWLAGLALTAATAEAPAGWTPRALTTQFLGRLPPGPIAIRVERLRQQRRVAALRAELRAAGDSALAVTTDVVFGASDAQAAPVAIPVPALPDPHTLPRLARLDPLAAFVRRFDCRVAYGPPLAGGSAASPIRSGGWLRPRQALAPSPSVLVMLADAWFPPAWAATAQAVPVSTVSLHVAFHGPDPGPDAADGFFAACHRQDGLAGGFGIERGTLWWPDGTMALTVQQLTWVGAASAPPTSTAVGHHRATAASA